MNQASQIEEVHVRSIELEGRTWAVSVAIENDGIEYVGHLWFADEAWDDEGLRDHGTLPGRSADEVARHARELSGAELVQRFRRAQVEQRRYHGLRQLTERVLSDIRHLNRVATSMRAGLLDVDDAASEIDATEGRLHQMVDELRMVAGVTR
jgi:hypothetical protein